MLAAENSFYNQLVTWYKIQQLAEKATYEPD
jgi:hypothetical protein